MKTNTELERVVVKIKELYYDLDMSDEDCILEFLRDLDENYDYDTLERYLEIKKKIG